MKTIETFRHEEYGLFIDLSGRPASVAVGRRDGVIHLNAAKAERSVQLRL